MAKKKGYFAVVLHTDDQVLRFRGPCDGPEQLMTSYRTELAGILATMYLINALQDFHKEDILPNFPYTAII